MPQSPHPEAQRFVPSRRGKGVAAGTADLGPTEVQRFHPPARGQNVAARDEATLVMRRLAEQQHGIVAHRQLIARGLGVRLIESRIARGQLIVLYRGVFALGHRRIGLYGEWMAAVLACGPGAVLSHGSAAQLWG